MASPCVVGDLAEEAARSRRARPRATVAGADEAPESVIVAAAWAVLTWRRPMKLREIFEDFCAAANIAHTGAFEDPEGDEGDA